MSINTLAPIPNEAEFIDACARIASAFPVFVAYLQDEYKRQAFNFPEQFNTLVLEHKHLDKLLTTIQNNTHKE